MAFINFYLWVFQQMKAEYIWVLELVGQKLRRLFRDSLL